MSRISLLPTEALIEELQARFDTIVFAGLKEQDEGQDKTFQYNGDVSKAVYLTQLLNQYLLKYDNLNTKVEGDPYEQTDFDGFK